MNVSQMDEGARFGAITSKRNIRHPDMRNMLSLELSIPAAKARPGCPRGRLFIPLRAAFLLIRTASFITARGGNMATEQSARSRQQLAAAAVSFHSGCASAKKDLRHPPLSRRG